MTASQREALGSPLQAVREAGAARVAIDRVGWRAGVRSANTGNRIPSFTRASSAEPNSCTAELVEYWLSEKGQACQPVQPVSQ